MGSDLTTMDDVVTLMGGSRSADEWNRNCDRVKRANGNTYPGFWYGAIVSSGVAARTAAGWGGDAEIHLRAGPIGPAGGGS